MKLVSFCSYFNVEDGRKKATFQHIMIYYFKKGKNTKKDMWSIWRRFCGWLNISKVVCEVSCLRFLPPWCSTFGRSAEVDRDQIETLRTINVIYHVVDSWHTPNIQIKCWKSHQLGYVNHFDVWGPQKLSRKTPSWS